MTEIGFVIDPKYLVESPVSPELSSSMLEFLRGVYRPNRIYMFANNEWCDHFDRKKLLETVDKLHKAGDLHDVLEKARFTDELTFLKELRRSGTRLKDVWKLLDQDHKPPKSLKKIVSSIGSFKDEVIFLNKENRDPARLIELTEKYSRKKMPTFTPAPFLSFFEKYSKYIEDIKLILDSSNPTLESHHKLRKNVRTLRHFYQLVNLVSENQEAKALADYLNPVSVGMGKVQDQIYVMQHNGTINVHEDTTCLSDSHRRIISNFINLHSTY